MHKHSLYEGMDGVGEGGGAYYLKVEIRMT